VDEGTTNVIEGASTERSPQDMATEIITVSVKPGMEEAYRDWVERIRLMEAKFPGHQGLSCSPRSLGYRMIGSRCCGSILQSI
jgi:antibiotic biosynthesis monooxygenase (ABM) superfamily enzyme